MHDFSGLIEKELLEAFYSVVADYRSGVIDDESFRGRLIMLAERYERHFGRKEPGKGEKELSNG